MTGKLEYVRSVSNLPGSMQTDDALFKKRG